MMYIFFFFFLFFFCMFLFFFFFFFFFFFSSRRRHTRCSRDWSSDVCSSDLRNRSSGTLAPGMMSGNGSATRRHALAAPTRRLSSAPANPIRTGFQSDGQRCATCWRVDTDPRLCLSERNQPGRSLPPGASAPWRSKLRSASWEVVSDDSFRSSIRQRLSSPPIPAHFTCRLRSTVPL